MGSSLDLDAIQRLLPDLEDLGTLLEAVLAASRPDAEETWSGTGALATVGARRVDVDALPGLTRRAAQEAADRIRRVYGAVAAALESVANDDLYEATVRLLEAAAVEEQAARASQAAAFAAAAVELAHRHGDPSSLSLALRRQARAERTLGSVSEALQHYVEAHGAAEASSDLHGQGESAIGAGNVLEQQGRWEEAEEWYRRALDILDGLQPPAPPHWHARLNLHIVLRTRGDVAASEPWLREAEALAEALDDPASHVFLGNARGQLAMAQDGPDTAEAFFLQALQAATSRRASATVRLNLAESFLARGRTLDATEQARAAERDALMGSASDKLPEVYRVLGRVAAYSGNPDAFVFFERSMELIGDHPSLLLERAQTLQAYGEAEAALKQHATAADLWRSAREAYEALGIPAFRRPWVDCYDAPFPDLDAKESTS